MRSELRGGMVSKIWLRAGLALACLLSVVPATAQPAPGKQVKVPAALKAWVPWVLADIGDAICTSVESQHTCVWPGRLTLEVKATGGRFRLQVVNERRAFVRLPGDKSNWPQKVEVDGKKLVVSAHTGRPQVMLSAGKHKVVGRFDWAKPPEVLAVPPGVARVVVVRGEQRTTRPRRSKNGGVWLGESEAKTTKTAERLEMDVFRHIADGVPLIVTTRLRLRVAGRARELSLGDPLLAGSELLSVQAGKLAVRLEASRALVVELKPGEHTVTLRARFAKPPVSLAVPTHKKPWPGAEVWVWAPAPNLRQVALSGAERVDPSRTNLPRMWHSLTAFKLRHPSVLKMKTNRRGDPTTPANRLRLVRTVWLDADGKGITARDQLSGQMHRDWRLDFAAGELGRARLNGKEQLISVNPKTKLAGVEIRSGRVQLTADWRAPFDGELAAGGWSVELESAVVELKLPAGWELLGATGVDELSSSWLSRWQLLDLLLVLLFALAIGKLCKPSWGLLALVALVLAQGVAEAPRYSWLVLVVVIVLLKQLAEGQARKAARALCWSVALTLGVLLVGFAAAELRRAIYPQTNVAVAERLLEQAEHEELSEDDADNKEGGSGTRAKGEEGRMGRQRAAAAAPKTKAVWGRDDSLRGGGMGGKKDSKKIDALKSLHWKAQVADETVIQTGPGVPEWYGPKWILSWSGPVATGQRASVLLSSPLTGGALAILRIVLMGLLAILLLRFALRLEPAPSKPSPPASDGGDGGGGGDRQDEDEEDEEGEDDEEDDEEDEEDEESEEDEEDGDSPVRARPSSMSAPHVVLLVSLTLALTAIALPASGQIPSTDMLNALKERLTTAPPCVTACIMLPHATLAIRDRALELDAEVHAGATSSYKLPGPAAIWVPDTVEVDGKPSSALVLVDGFLHLRLNAGIHRVKLRGPIVGDSVTIDLGAVPMRGSVEAPGWQIDGIDNTTGKVEQTIQLSRVGASKPSDPTEKSPAEAPKVAPWLQITRIFEFGVNWRIRTLIKRMSATGGPIVQRYALLPGEKVTTPTAITEKDELLISLGRNADSAVFASILKPSAGLELRAADKKPWSEVWTLRCGSIWHCSSTGLAADGGGQGWSPSFHPWPGEKLSVRLHRPPAAKGPSLTVDVATLSLAPTSRRTTGWLSFELRSSTGGLVPLNLPSDLEVRSLRVRGSKQPIQRDGATLKLSVLPGKSRVMLDISTPQKMSWRYRAPKLRVAEAAVNTTTSINVPPDRWLVWASGPGRGPAILFWMKLLLLLAAAVVVAKLPQSPLPLWQWLLLAVGSSLLPAILAPVAACWFFAVDRRKDWCGRRPLVHNLVQAGLVLLTSVLVLLLASAIYIGLQEPPPTSIGGELSWYVARSDGSLPQSWVLSTPMWLWRALVAVWSLALGYCLIGWLRDGWTSFKSGSLWLSPQEKRA